MKLPTKLLAPILAIGIPSAAGTRLSDADEPHGTASYPPTVVARRAGDSAVGSPGARSADTVPVQLPDSVRGLYVNRWTAVGPSMRRLIALARDTEINALVIDVKDDRGLMLYRSGVPLARTIKSDVTSALSPSRLRSLMDTLHANGIYPIARIVVVKDPLLASKKPEWAIHRGDDSTAVWLDRAGNAWLDPTRTEIWEYAADIAVEAARAGFREVQLDYVRYPDEPGALEEARFAQANGRDRAQVIRDQLELVREKLRPHGVPLAIDVFGLTATDTSDMGIGQRWESFIDRVDVVLPMVYPSHFAPGAYGIENPNANPYQTVDRALEDAIYRSRGIAGAARIVPWYQDFTLGAPRYTAEHVRAQIRAGYDNGIRSWILWNPASRYTRAALLVDSTFLLPH